MFGLASIVCWLDCMSNHKPPPEIQLLDEVQQFLQAAVHDLRASHRRTNIAAELLLQSPDDSERNELLSQMAQGLAKTDQLLTAIGSYSAVLVPARYTMAVFPSVRAVRFALANLDPQIRETGATITVGDLPDIPGDRDRLAELFAHLIANSLKFRGSEPPAIGISAQRVPEGWQFSVRDRGIGIPAKYNNRLFIPFRRLHGAEVPGTGLGLAISRKIVEAHGGRIWVEPGEGPGVTFSLVLPAADGD